MQEILMTSDTAFLFLIWSYYHHDILPQEDVSYRSYGKFSESDAQKLDEMKTMLFKCYEAGAIERSCQQFDRAKIAQEPCPFPKEELDNLFAKEAQK